MLRQGPNTAATQARDSWDAWQHPSAEHQVAGHHKALSGRSSVPAKELGKEDLPGGSVVTDLPMQGAQVQSQVRELDPTCHN